MSGLIGKKVEFYHRTCASYFEGTIMDKCNGLHYVNNQPFVLDFYIIQYFKVMADNTKEKSPSLAFVKCDDINNIID
jgi:hypothetical protein